MADPVTRASSPARGGQSGGNPAAGGGKKFLGQPTWLWVVGAVLVGGGYLYLKSHASQQAANKNTGQGTGGGSGGGGGGYSAPAPWTTETFKSWTQEHHNHPARKRK